MTLVHKLVVTTGWVSLYWSFFFFFFLSPPLYNSDTVISIIFATFWEGLTGLLDNLAFLMCFLILIIVNNSPNDPKIHVLHSFLLAQASLVTAPLRR